MRRLDRYLLRELVVPLLLCLGGFLILWVTQDIINELDRFRAAGLGGADLIEYYLYRLPDELPRLLPIALLLALLYSLTSLARHNELVAIRCAGVSLWRMSLPFYTLGILLSGGLFIVTDYFMADSQETATAVLKRRISEETGLNRDLVNNFTFRNDQSGRVWEAASFDKRRYLLTSPIVRWDLGDGKSRTISAAAAHWTNGVWRFELVTHWRKKAADDTPPAETASFLEFPGFAETPEVFLNHIEVSGFSVSKLIKKSRFPLRKILLYLKYKTEMTEEEEDMIYTQLHARLAAPWTCLVVVMIAIPFASLSGKRNAFVGVASSLVFCFSYFVLLRFGLALGTSGALPAWLAAWGPNLFFASLGVGMTWKAN